MKTFLICSFLLCIIASLYNLAILGTDDPIDVIVFGCSLLCFGLYCFGILEIKE